MTFDEIITALKRSPRIKTKSRIAWICGVSPQALNCWRRIPAEYARKLEHASEGAVTRYDMRPDVFGPAAGDDSDLVDDYKKESVA